jgi:hypothetical protein
VMMLIILTLGPFRMDLDIYLSLMYLEKSTTCIILIEGVCSKLSVAYLVRLLVVEYVTNL